MIDSLFFILDIVAMFYLMNWAASDEDEKS